MAPTTKTRRPRKKLSTVDWTDARSVAVFAATMANLATDLLVFIVVLVLGIVQGTIPHSGGPGRSNLYQAGPGYPAFHVPLAIYVVLALVWLAFAIITIRPQQRSGFLNPGFVLFLNIFFAGYDFIVSESYAGDPGWPHLAWIGSIIRVAAAIISIVVLVRERRAKKRRR